MTDPNTVKADIDGIMMLAKNSYYASELYAEFTKKLVRTDSARSSLADKNGEATQADLDLIAMLEEFDGFLRTTTARYYLAGEKLTATAEDYVKVHDEWAGNFNEMNKDIEKAGIDDFALSGSASELANDTRPYGTDPEQPEELPTEHADTDKDDKTGGDSHG